MTDLAAMLIRAGRDPEVVTHTSWGFTAVSEVLGDRHTRGVGLTWQTRKGCWLLVVAGMHATEANPAAAALAGRDGEPLHGPLLVFAMSDQTREITSLDERDLLLIATRLLIGETRALGAVRGPQRIAAAAGQSIPTQPN